MEKAASFTVFNASAGSGKTFTLVQSYLRILLASDNPYLFKKILAITFTNKAAAEMKERILLNLESCAQKTQSTMIDSIQESLGLEASIIQIRAAKIVKAILRDYGEFAISTIDSFTYKLIKTFAYDLNIPLNFEVELDAKKLLNEAIDVVVSKIGQDQDLTEVLLSYAIQKSNEDRSWDIILPLREIGLELLKEDAIANIATLSDLTIKDFKQIRKELIKECQEIKTYFTKTSKEALNLIENSGLEHADFSYSDLPNFFKKFLDIATLKTDSIQRSGRLYTNIEKQHPQVATKAAPYAKATIATILPQLESFYHKLLKAVETKYGLYVLYSLSLDALVPLAVLKYINEELEAIKKANNVRLNAEFNRIIFDTIKEQPAPFIYERLGEKYQHYFIDEMQDTSVLQWQNLIKLIDNALASDGGSLLLVGDAKQSIYRWRGGKAEQYIALSSHEDTSKEGQPFYLPKTVAHLDSNYRSQKEVVVFNNSFFTSISAFLLEPMYSEIFAQTTTQKVAGADGGFVSIEFVPKVGGDEEDLLPFKVLEVIRNLDPSYDLNEVCILVRKKAHGHVLSNYLMQEGFTIQSSESLLLSESAKVQFIANFLNAYILPHDALLRVDLARFIHQNYSLDIDIHLFLLQCSEGSFSDFLLLLEEYQFNFNRQLFDRYSLFDSVSYLISIFQLNNSPDAYIQYFLDVVFDFQRKDSATIASFVDYWDSVKESSSIVIGENKNAIQVLTIHKAKGLEFPVVIFPYDLDMEYKMDPKEWVSVVDDPILFRMKSILLKASKNFQSINEEAREIYHKDLRQQYFDHVNVLYVALTRAVEQLYIVTRHEVDAKGVFKTKYYSGLFAYFLEEVAGITEGIVSDRAYSFGSKERTLSKKELVNNVVYLEYFQQNTMGLSQIDLVTRNASLWGTSQGDSIVFGNRIHALMASVHYVDDIDGAISNFIEKGWLLLSEEVPYTTLLTNIVQHPQLEKFYAKNVLEVHNEQEVVYKNKVLIPDRIVVLDKEIIIIDYKTGKPQAKYQEQLNQYERVVRILMGEGKPIKKILVYIEMNDVRVEVI